MKPTTPLVASLVTVTALGTASAQPTPTFAYGKAEEVKEVKEVDWTATAEAGLLVTRGNSDTVTASATGTAMRLDPKNKLVLQVMLAYARSSVFIAVDDDMSGTIGADEINEATSTTANSWQTKLRYDRFLTEHNSLYVAASIGADKPAGKELVGGGQAGYSRQLYKTDKHEVVAEVGYDFTYEDLTVGDPLAIHSARLFSGYKGAVRAETAVEASVEALSNLNTLDTVPDEAGPFEDTRITGVAGLTTKLTAAVSFSFSFTLKYDNVPAPRGPIGGIPYDAGFVPVSDDLDTITKATIIVSLF